jgi:RHS repeat-associated protein
MVGRKKIYKDQRVNKPNNSSGSSPRAEVRKAIAGMGGRIETGYYVHWTKQALASGGGKANAIITRWAEAPVTAAPVELPVSVKAPLTNRQWFKYAGQQSIWQSGTASGPVVASQVMPDGSTLSTLTSYTAKGRVASVADSQGRQTIYEYHANGDDLHRVRHVAAGQDDVLLVLDGYAAGQPTAVTGADGALTTLGYNVRGQLIAVVNPLSQNTSLTYEENAVSPAFGRRKTVTAAVGTPLASTTTFDYDAYGRLATVTDPETDMVTFAYDAISGDPLKTLDRMTMTTGPDGSGAWVLWDKVDAAEQHEFHPGAADRVTIFTRDANRKVTDVEQPSGKHVGYVQGNCCGSIDTLVDSAGNQTHWQYDVLGRVAAKWLRWGQPGEVQVQTLGYDAVGRPTSIQDARGNAKTFGYDAEGRLSAIQYAVNAANTRPTSDVALSYEPVYGRLATVSDGTGVTSYGYVPINAADGVFGDGALATESKSVGAGVQFTHSYSYDALGRTITGPRQTSAQWDALGRLTGATSGLGAFTFGYQGNSGRLATVDAALTDATVAFNTGFTYQGAAEGRRLNGIVHQVGFAPADWRVLSQHHFGYDAFGRLSTWQKSWRDWATAMQTGTWALTHDTDDQLTGVAETDAAATPTGSFAYGYDLAGNRTTADRTTPAGGTVNRQWTPNGLNQLTAQSAGPEAGAYTHDADGNLLADNTRTYQWDAENRLVGVTGPFGTVTWAYDAFSRRVKQHDTAPAGPEIVRDLIWEGLSIIESRDQATGEIRRYYGNGEERELAATITRLHYTTDHLGSIRELTDATGTIRARYDYDPYGNVTKLSGDLDSDFGFTGHYYHAASGLHLAPYRGYDPRLGRWLSRDPIDEEGGINLYGYVSNNPINATDPLGLTDFFENVWAYSGEPLMRNLFGPEGLITSGMDAVLNGPENIARGLGCSPSAATGIAMAVPLPGGKLKAGKVVIGETMDRVIPMAKNLGADWYKARGTNAANFLRNNMQSLRRQMKKGKEICDAGLDKLRKSRSPNYKAEKELLEKHNYPTTPIE